MLRSEVKMKHEEAVLDNFRRFLGKQNRTLRITDRPDPPDAIVTIDGKETWIEITDAYFSQQLAESITSGISSDKQHRPVPKEKRAVIEPDKEFDSIIDSEIQKKYLKMKTTFAKYGSGILLIGIQSPFTNAETISSGKQVDARKFSSKDDCKLFGEVYFYDTSGSAFYQADLIDAGQTA